MVINEIKEYVKQGDVVRVRKELLAILNANPDLGDGQFKDNIKYAINNLGIETVFEPFSGEFEIKMDEGEWTTSYVAKIYLQLRKEFSDELIQHLLKVAPIAYKEKVAQRDLSQQTNQKTRELSLKVEQKQNNFRLDCVKIVIWLVIIVAIIGLILFGGNMF